MTVVESCLFHAERGKNHHFYQHIFVRFQGVQLQDDSITEFCMNVLNSLAE